MSILILAVVTILFDHNLLDSPDHPFPNPFHRSCHHSRSRRHHGTDTRGNHSPDATDCGRAFSLVTAAIPNPIQEVLYMFSALSYLFRVMSFNHVID